MAMTERRIFVCAWLWLLLVPVGGAQTAIRVGAFPNITHPQAMVGKNNGWFDKAMGPQVRIEWKSFNAGPSAIEALFAGAIDMTYIGPNPAISGYVRSNGEALRIVAGATSGGAALVVRGRFGDSEAGRFSREEGRVSPDGQHAGCGAARVVESARHEVRRTRAATCRSFRWRILTS
jgi:ABC-type taurine transport system substrate-binding protein